jgi:hypothetical protein
MPVPGFLVKRPRAGSLDVKGFLDFSNPVGAEGLEPTNLTDVNRAL